MVLLDKAYKSSEQLHANLCKKVWSKYFFQMDGAQLDWGYAYKEKAWNFQNETVCTNAVKIPPEAWYEM